MIKKIVPSIAVVARTDAHSVEGIEEAIERAKAYEKAGADTIFPEALSKEEHFRHFAAEISLPLLANMTEFGKTPYYTASQFESMGYSIVLFPVTSLRVAAKAYEDAFKEILKKMVLKKKH